MCKTLFLIGRSGSGKSTLVRWLHHHTTLHLHSLSAFPLLNRLYWQDTQGMFTTDAQGGFVVHNPQVYHDLALLFSSEILSTQQKLPPETLLCVEVAPTTEDTLFWQSGIARGATGVYIETPLEMCVERVLNRAKNRQGHAIPASVLRTRYRNSCLDYYQRYATDLFGFAQPLTVLDNNGTKEVFLAQVSTWFAQETYP